LFPESSTTAGDIQTINLGRQLTAAVDVQRVAVGSPRDRRFSYQQTGIGFGSPEAVVNR
jgi:hypothetical protein